MEIHIQVLHKEKRVESKNNRHGIDAGNHQKLTNGPLWSQNLATSWDASLYSFAFSGAVCSNRMYSTKQFIPSIEDQIEIYYNQSLQLNPEETITIFWVGVNDIYHIYEQGIYIKCIKCCLY